MAEFEEKLNAILGNQEAMGQIMSLARSLNGNEEEPPGGATPPPPNPPDLSALLGQLDPSMLSMATGLLQQYGGKDDRNTALLAALRPFLKEERQERLNQAMEIARMTRLVRVALDTLGRKGEGDV